MKRVMIQANDELLERAQQLARERGVTFPQLVRQALVRELARETPPVPALRCAGVVATGGAARRRGYEPDAWR